MAKCKKCGNYVPEGALFCDNCKKSFTSGTKNTFGKGLDAFLNAEDFTAAYSARDIAENRLFAALCYIPLIGFFPIIFKTKNSKFVRFHANHGLTLFILEILTSALFLLLSIIPVVGTILALPLSLASSFTNLLYFLLIGYGVICAYTGKAKVIPVIGKIRYFKA